MCGFGGFRKRIDSFSVPEAGRFRVDVFRTDFGRLEGAN